MNPDGIPTISRSNPTKSRRDLGGIPPGSRWDPGGIPVGIPSFNPGRSHRDPDWDPGGIPPGFPPIFSLGLSLVFAAVVCVYWYSMLYDNIGVKILSMKIFFQILFVWEENDLVFSSELVKIALKQQHKNSPPPPPPPTHTH